MMTSSTDTPTRAIIDLGTNTFHLLIAQPTSDGEITEIYRERIFVKLAAGGIETIAPEPFARGLRAMHHFREKIDQYDCAQVTAIGTAALRTASNGPDFVGQVRQETGLNIRLISGDQEADYITRGVLAAMPPREERLLIMDIGGGSTEFILVAGEQRLFRQSFPIGVSVLYNEFHHSDPISPADQAALNAHLTTVTQPLADALRQYPTHHLAGAAGTFDVLGELLLNKNAPASPTSRSLNVQAFPELAHKIIHATATERLQMPNIPPERADMIVVAMLLLEFTLELARITEVTVSDWAMKEGILLSS